MRSFFAIFGITAVLIFTSANAEAQVFIDTFDSAPSNGVTRVLSIDNSATGGQFPSSTFDVFGVVDRTVNFDFSDDSALFPGDTFGLFSPSKADMFLGFADTSSPDNPTGAVNVTWTANTTGLSGLSLSFDVAAMGDFESTDVLSFTASFDGGAEETLFTSTFMDTPDTDTFSYTLDDGSLALAPFSTDTNIKDPFVIDGQTVINELQSFTFPIAGSGSQLTLTLNSNLNGGGEVLAIDNVSVSAIPEPSSAILLILGSCGLVARRRRA